MKKNTLKKITIVLLILLISLISFMGIYQKQLNRMVNILPEYKVGMDFGEIREVRLDVSNATETKYFDENGVEVDEPEEDSEESNITSREVAVNPEEALNAENYAIVKDIMLKRLDTIGATEYHLRQDENGYFAIEFPENENTSLYIDTIATTGKFEIKDNETSEILLNNNNIKDATVVTYPGETGTATVYLIINFNKEGKEKLEEISNVYVQTTDDEGNTTTKNVLITLDDETIMNTYFGQTMTTGQIQIPIGNATSSESALSTYIAQAQLIASVLKHGNLPITYEITYENILSSTIRQDAKQILTIIVGVVIIIAVAYMIVRYNNGLLLGLSWIGFIACLLLVLRFTNSIISLNSIVATVIICVFDYIFLNAILHNKKGRAFKEIMVNYAMIGIPMYIIAVVFTFARMTTVSSFGIALFWGSILMMIYNLVITKNLHEDE